MTVVRGEVLAPVRVGAFLRDKPANIEVDARTVLLFTRDLIHAYGPTLSLRPHLLLPFASTEKPAADSA